MEKNAIILKILKRSMTINKHFQFLKDTVLTDIKGISEQNSLKVAGFQFADDISYVEISDHSLMRWNTRVGPSLSLSALEDLFNKLILLPHRLKKIKEGFGIVDSEIIFTYEMVGKKLLITTFYGRRSLNHALYQIEALRGYNSYYNEQVMLEFESDVLEVQTPPAIPMVFMEFQGIRLNYYLEGYRVSGKELPVFVVHCVPGDTIVIDMNKNPDIHINKSVLLALFLMRYRDFVWDYLQLNYNERVSRLQNK